MATIKYAPKIPFLIDSKTGNIENITNGLQNAKQNLKMVLLTNPGEKFMDPAFGVGLQKLLFDPSRFFDAIDAKKTLSAIIIAQAEKYLIDITIQSVDVTADGERLRLVINYLYKNTIADSLAV
jgi:phage baseplate assembly protein W